MKEDGELSEEEVEQVYIPVDRPAPMQTNVSTIIQHSSSSSSSEQNSSDDSNKRQKKKKLSKNTAQKPTTFNKYNIWTNALQEESLMENLRGCDVNNKRKRGRNVEDYDYNLKYKLNNGETSNDFKRRKSNSEDGESQSRNKIRKYKDQKLHAPRNLLDLAVMESNNDQEIAYDIAEKLQEENSDLILRIVKSVGFNICYTIYEETKKTEANGGLLIMNGRRRRTSGGVFLFLLKKSKQIDELQFHEIFKENKSLVVENQETLQLTKKDRDLDLLNFTVSNPPPSPDHQNENSQQTETNYSPMNLLDS